MEMCFALVTFDVVVKCTPDEYFIFQRKLRAEEDTVVVHSDLGGLYATYIVVNDCFRLVSLQWEEESCNDYAE